MNTDPKNLQAKRVVYYILGVLEVLLAFRLIFKLLGANPQSPFVSFIYSVSQAFLIPFNGIFRSAVTKGIEAQSVLEPTTIIAMIVYAIMAWGIVKLIEISRPAHNNDIR
ncbi:MAG TPA: YggT family protein [Desulfosporosinus sp.]|nr:YggT family protein [Desulfosporosinus sp.]